MGRAPDNIIGAIAFGPDGTLYATGFQPGIVDAVLWEVTLSQPAAVFTVISVLPFFADSLAVRPSDGVIFAVPGGFSGATKALYTIDPLTGIVNQVGPAFANGWGVSDLAFASQPVPEPATGLLLLVATGAAAVVRRRHR